MGEIWLWWIFIPIRAASVERGIVSGDNLCPQLQGFLCSEGEVCMTQVLFPGENKWAEEEWRHTWPRLTGQAPERQTVFLILLISRWTEMILLCLHEPNRCKMSLRTAACCDCFLLLTCFCLLPSVRFIFSNCAEVFLFQVKTNSDFKLNEDTGVFSVVSFIDMNWTNLTVSPPVFVLDKTSKLLTLLTNLNKLPTGKTIHWKPLGKYKQTQPDWYTLVQKDVPQYFIVKRTRFLSRRTSF